MILATNNGDEYISDPENEGFWLIKKMIGLVNTCHFTDAVRIQYD